MIERAGATGQALNIIAGGRLRSGDFVSARVSDVLPGNRYRILLNGKTMTAESQLNLLKGQVISARVEHSGTSTILRLLDPGAAAGRHLPAGDAAPRSGQQLLALAFLRASLAVPEDTELQRMGALLDRSRGRKMRLARLQADLVARGADPSADFLEALEELLGGGEREGRGRGRQGTPWKTVPEPQELEDELRGERNDELLDLVSNSPSKADTWTFHRMKRMLDDREVLVVWKIRHGREPALALTVRDSGRTLEFFLKGIDPVRMSVFADPESGISDEKWKIFNERLSLMNISVDDTISPMEASDGFEGA